jgi:hypothetical protein
MLAENHVHGCCLSDFPLEQMIFGSLCWQMILQPPAQDCWINANIFFEARSAWSVIVCPRWVTALDSTVDSAALVKPLPAMKKYCLVL